MGKSTKASFRVGPVKGFLRGSVWYLCYHEGGLRRRPRVGRDADQAKGLAAQVAARLERGVLAAPAFEPVSLGELQSRWLAYHEHVRRSSVSTIARYRTATAHLLRFATGAGVASSTGTFAAAEAERFVRYLREVEVAPNGHRNTAKRRLRDKGVSFVLSVCRSLFAFAVRRRHLPGYAANPFADLDVGSIPIEDAKPVVLLTADHEVQFLDTCDEWQFPVFLTLMLTGLRPGELAHLLLPGDLDLERGVLRVRNKPGLGWQVKTRAERDVPLHPVLVEVLRREVGDRRTGPVFRQRRCRNGHRPPLQGRTYEQLEQAVAERVVVREKESGRGLTRAERGRVAAGVWRDLSAVDENRIRIEFMRVTRAIGLPHLTMPKALRHGFATCLQDANVDPLIRMQLMGHSPGAGRAGGGLGMTAVYTHSRPETVRRQLEAALVSKPLELVGTWLRNRSGPVDAVLPQADDQPAGA